MSKKKNRRKEAKEKSFHAGDKLWKRPSLGLKAHNPAGVKASAEKLAAIEAMPDTECSREFIPGLCKIKHGIAKIKAAKGFPAGPCALCLRILEAKQ